MDRKNAGLMSSLAHTGIVLVMCGAVGGCAHHGGPSPGPSNGGKPKQVVKKAGKSIPKEMGPQPMTPGASVTAAADVSMVLSEVQFEQAQPEGAPTTTTWSGQLWNGSAIVGGASAASPAGSVELVSGELYIKATTSGPVGGVYPIVVTTGGVRAGSIGTAWFCLRDAASNTTYYALLSPSDSTDMPGPVDSKLCIYEPSTNRSVMLDTYETFVALPGCAFPPSGLPIIKPIPDSRIAAAVTAAKARAKAAGLRD